MIVIDISDRKFEKKGLVPLSSLTMRVLVQYPIIYFFTSKIKRYCIYLLVLHNAVAYFNNRSFLDYAVYI